LAGLAGAVQDWQDWQVVQDAHITKNEKTIYAFNGNNHILATPVANQNLSAFRNTEDGLYFLLSKQKAEKERE